MTRNCVMCVQGHRKKTLSILPFVKHTHTHTQRGIVYSLLLTVCSSYAVGVKIVETTPRPLYKLTMREWEVTMFGKSPFKRMETHCTTPPETKEEQFFTSSNDPH